MNIDERRLTQVLVNLLSNSLRYTTAGSIVVTVRAKEAPTGQTAQILVADTGQGMTPEQIGHLFRPFGQVHDAPQQGTGLGLHLSKLIVEAHGGRIRIESPGPGKGATAIIDLPVVP